MRVLVTGGGGFVGQWLARSLLERRDDIVLAGLGEARDHPRILSDDEWSRLRWRNVDLRDADAVSRLVHDAMPDLVVHLAGVSFPPDADVAPVLTYDVNALGAVRLLSSLSDLRRKSHANPTILIVGSALQYGSHSADEMPLSEDAAQRPLTIYAAAKAAQEVAALQFYRSDGLRVICTRSFNHSGVGHGSAFVLPSLAKRVSDIARGKDAPVLRFGNDVVRDYLHIADVVRAYLLLSDRGLPGEVYNVCSGVGHTTLDLARMTLQHAGVRADICTEPSLVRPSDISVLVGSAAKLQRDTGWEPRRTCDDIIDDLLDAASN
jgi:GDP-4-dehydro-6-deoxy-D-mannose reductase